MEPKSLDEIHRFTASVDQMDLYTYLDLEVDADRAAILHALQVRRSWAQGQQANPKFRIEALWVIKNIALITAALTTDATAYQNDLSARDEQKKLETLSIFIKGTLADGDLTARAEEAIQAQGELLGLNESTVIRRIGEILAERDANTADSVESNPYEDEQFDETSDLYEILKTPPDSDQETLEKAYRERYRWARQLQDRDKSSRVYAMLDEAWRVLKDPERRAAYDAERANSSQNGASSQQTRMGLLPPPPPTQGLALPMPTVERRLEQIEAGIDTAGGPNIEMPKPEPAPERDAPPPPVIPPSVEENEAMDSFEFDEPLSINEFEEPDLSIDDDDGDEVVFRMPTTPMDAPTEAPESDGLMGSTGLTDTEKALAGLEGLPPDMGLDDFQQMSSMMEFDEEMEEPSSPPESDAEMATFPNPDGLADTGIGQPLDTGELESSQPSNPSDGLPTEDEDTDESVLSAGQLFNDDAVLKIEGSRTIRIRTGSNPFPVRITVLNTGQGHMPGRVSTDVDWVQLSPKMLDPNRGRQVIEALVEPDGMPSNSAKAIVTIDTEHGETRTVTIDALKHVVSPVMMFVSALSLIGLVGVFLGLYFSGIIGSDIETPDRTILAINVDPPAGEVYINDKLVGNQGTLSLVDSFPINEPFQVRVELDGFEPFLREVTVPNGTQIRVEADLILRDEVNFRPGNELARATIDQDALETALEQRENAINACFTRHLPPMMTPYSAKIDVTSIVTSRGAIEGIEFANENFQSPAVELCLRRQLRAINLPLLAGDYAEFTRTYSAEIRPNSVLNNEDTTP